MISADYIVNVTCKDLETLLWELDRANECVKHRLRRGHKPINFTPETYHFCGGCSCRNDCPNWGFERAAQAPAESV